VISVAAVSLAAAAAVESDQLCFKFQSRYYTDTAPNSVFYLKRHEWVP